MNDPEKITWGQIDDALAILGFTDRRRFMRLEIVGRTQVRYLRVVRRADGQPDIDGNTVRTETLTVPVVRGPAPPRQVGESARACRLMLLAIGAAGAVVFAAWLASRVGGP